MTTKVTGSVLANTAVTSGTYGGIGKIPALTVDPQGRITFAANNTPSGTYDISVSGTASGLVETGSNAIIATTNGSERLRITSNGNVGIGTSNPLNPLEVTRATGNLGKSIFYINHYNTGTENYTNYEASLYNYNPDTYGGAFVLGFSRGTADSKSAVAIGDSIGGYFFQGYSGTAWYNIAFIECTVTGTPSGGIVPGAMLFHTMGSEKMRITADGNVGIETTVTDPLDFNQYGWGPQFTIGGSRAGYGGNLQLVGNITSGNAGCGIIAFINKGADNNYYNHAQIQTVRVTDSTSDLAFSIGTGLENMRITADGNVGINTSAPINWGAGYEGLTINATLDPTLHFSVNGTERGWIGGGYSPTLSAGYLYIGTENLLFDAGRYSYRQYAPTSKSTAATLTTAELLVGIIQYTGSFATLTLPTGTSLDSGTGNFGNDWSFDFSVINTGSGNCTIGANGNTTVGSLTVAAATSGRFRVRKTATNTFTIYRIS